MKRMRMFFAPDTGADGGAGADNAPAVTDNGAGTTPTQTAEQEQPKYTDKQVNDLIAKNKGKAVAELLQKSGFASEEELNKALAEFKKMQDANKSETEKLQSQKDDIAKKLTEAEARATLAEFRAEALAQGVGKETSEKVAKWAQDYDGETTADKVKAFLAENPQFADGGESTAKQAGTKFSSKTTNQLPNKQAEMLELIKKNMA